MEGYPPGAAEIAAALRAQALQYPEAVEDHPWGETAFKVRGKVFLFLGVPGEEVTFSVKLPESRDMAAAFPFTHPTGYGLGKHGWVTVRVTPGAEIPEELLTDWIDESYRTIAPKKLVALLPTGRQ